MYQALGIPIMVYKIGTIHILEGKMVTVQKPTAEQSDQCQEKQHRICYGSTEGKHLTQTSRSRGNLVRIERINKGVNRMK